MAWISLFIAGLFEIGWVVALKRASQTQAIGDYAMTGVLMFISIALLSYAMRTLPMGTSYAVWTGIGAAGAAVLGIALYSEPATLMRLGSIGLICAGVIGLKLQQG